MAPNCLYFSILVWMFLIIQTSAKRSDWTNHGGDLHNRRYAHHETKIGPKTVANLKLKWKFVAGKDITATPAIYKNTIYFPCWNGNIYALNASNGSIIWQRNLGQLTGLNSTGYVQGANWTLSRSTPTVARDLLIVGIYGPAYILGLNISNGELVWSTQLDPHYAALITMSGTYHKSAFYVGTSSAEEVISSIEACCSFRGAFFKLNASNGNILWQTYMLPDNNGSSNKYAGAALWGSSPSIDINRNAVYIATGNLYSAPLNVTQCQEAQNNQTSPTEEDKCIEPDNHSNSVLALDLDSGHINWYRQLGGYDVWFLACNNLSTSGCPPGPNPDADFGEAPMILSVNDHGKRRDIVSLVQKSGIAWALDRDNGSIVWSTSSDWTNHGGDLHNHRYAYHETKISPKTVANLRLKWKFVAGRDITATPTIYNNTIYFPSWNGNIYALNASNGSVIWQQNLEQLTGINTTKLTQGVNWTVSRTTPAVADDILIVGIYGPAYIIGLNIANGELVWSTQLDTHYAAYITMSGTYHKSAFYVGTSSAEESSSIEACCTFRGSFFKLNASNGNILWQTYMLPDNNGSTNKYAGAALWGSSPSIDVNRNAVYIATGNLYSAPLNVTQCQEAQNNKTTPTEEDKCIEPDNHSNSVLALDLDSGHINWYRQLGGYDVWFFACNNLSMPGCPPGPNPDADFGEAPMILSVNDHGKERDIVALVQKSGIAWALDRDNGSIVWSMEAGPGGAGGGGTWGSATDEKAVYTNIANSLRSNFTLKPSNITTTSGGWVSMDAASGNVLWSTENPSNATASGPVSLANGVVFAGSTNGTGPIYALSAATREILWSYDTGATVYGGMSISNGCVYVGNGYKFSLGAFDPTFTPGGTLFAFCILP